ncbi:glycosyltransferase [Aerosticca soli]|uniref:Glycosyltransferase n=1 Tax=Aerosticca soli TaxID=2010829 RepID=A0A2Z6E2W8_9GAMM|nr:glycosyltransferase [Aerosticca soli]BBD78878.1 hypothetical protein ALSL_0206 [Aerosticca soli]
MSSSADSNAGMPKGILVLGMHRSGTSALTRVLNLLGAQLSSTLWEANEANRRGFWEDPRIFGIHDELLRALGRNWDDLRALPEHWMDSAAASSARERLVDLLRAEFSQSRLWVVKDPRICRLLPLWKRIFEQLDVRMHCVLALRHPDEVARSLKSRNDHALARSRLAWLEHTAESVLGSRGFPRAVVSYDQLMTDWEAAMRRVSAELELPWPVQLEDVRPQVNEFLSPGERHHQVPWMPEEGSRELIDRLFVGMLRASEGQGWELAEEAARSYVGSRHAFLDALNSEQEAFEMQQQQWMCERQALTEAFEGKLQACRQALGEELAAQVAATVAREVEARLAAQADTVRSQLEEFLDSHTTAMATTLEQMSAKMESLRAAIDAVRPAQAEMAALQESRRRLEEEVRALRSSSSWRLTAPLRLAASMLRRPRTAMRRAGFLVRLTLTSVRQNGLLKTAAKIVAAPRKYGFKALLAGIPDAGVGQIVAAADETRMVLPEALPALDRLDLRVLMIAELGLPQCRQYRVVQKQQMLEKLGIDSTVVSWTDVAKCRSLLQTHSVVIFYRVPGFPDQLQLMREAKALGLATFWEVDDIIFDEQKYRANTNLRHLDEKTHKGILFGIPLYRAALLECGAGIASTRGVAEAMREAGVSTVFVVENALDGAALRVAAGIRREKADDGLVRIVYGSGSRAHDADFRVAARAIRRVLRARPNARLTVMGELNLPAAEYAGVMQQVERLPTCDYETYLRRLAACDIAIAPLEDTSFNDAKSNIKFLEASIVHLPSVCSPRAAFRSAIEDGVSGYLADDGQAWEKALLSLVDDAALRESMAQRAYQHVMAHYTLPRLAAEQLEPVFRAYRDRRRPKLRVLGVNIFFAPRSFGGATIVAEEMMKRINRREDVEYAMFTTVSTDRAPPYELVRYGAAAGDVFAMGLPHEGAPAYAYANPHSIHPFLEALHAYRPDIVHLHSVQGIGARIAEVCIRERIPFAVTLHDAWWICERQFMVNAGGHYCYQRKIDLDICAACVPDRKANRTRQALLRDILRSAVRLFSPSEFFRQLYLDNGFDPARVLVNKNGIVPPRRAIRRPSLHGRPLRMGFVGGEGPIKGAPLIRKALRSLPYTHYELQLVDNELNLGRRSVDPATWDIPGQLKVVPAYTQDSIDDFFEGIDVLLFPTQWKESFGLTVREALVRDVWVIATDAGGVVEDIVSGENGDVIPFGDDGTQLALAIGRLLEDPTRLEGHRNPHADRIRFFDEQAEEICRYFFDIVAERQTEAAAGLTLADPAA